MKFIRNIIMKSGQLPLVFLVLIFISSCSDKIVGEWNIVRYEKGEPGKPKVTVQNIGTMRFRNNRTGEKEITYGILRNKVSASTPFNWSSTDNFITINEDSEFGKTWVRVENKRNHQVLTSTNGADIVQVLELRK